MGPVEGSPESPPPTVEACHSHARLGGCHGTVPERGSGCTVKGCDFAVVINWECAAALKLHRGRAGVIPILGVCFAAYFKKKKSWCFKKKNKPKVYCQSLAATAPTALDEEA